MMKFNWKKAAGAAVMSFALVGATMSATTISAKAGNGKVLGAAILGGIVGGLVGGAVRRCHGHGAGGNHCHNHNGGHNHYTSGIVYVQPRPVIVQPAPQPVYPAGFPPSHYQWCFNKYGSYNQASNTYQPFRDVYGNWPPRRPCRSPWG